MILWHGPTCAWHAARPFRLQCILHTLKLSAVAGVRVTLCNSSPLLFSRCPHVLPAPSSLFRHTLSTRAHYRSVLDWSQSVGAASPKDRSSSSQKPAPAARGPVSSTIPYYSTQQAILQTLRPPTLGPLTLVTERPLTAEFYDHRLAKYSPRGNKLLHPRFAAPLEGPGSPVGRASSPLPPSSVAGRRRTPSPPPFRPQRAFYPSSCLV